MALKSKLTKEEFAILPDVLKAEYTERGGHYVLEVDGLVDRGALENERKEKAAAAKQFAELKAQIGDLDPIKAREAMKQVQELQNKQLLDAGKVDELIEARTAAMRTDHDNQVNAFKTQISEKDKTLGALTGELKKLTIDSAIRSLAIEKGARKEALDDIVARMTLIGVDGIKWDLRDGKPVALKEDQIVFGKDASQPMPFDEGLALLSTRAAHLFEPSNGGGARNDKGNSGGAFTISSDDARDPGKYRQMREAAEKAGQPLTIQ